MIIVNLTRSRSGSFCRFFKMIRASVLQSIFQLCAAKNELYSIGQSILIFSIYCILKNASSEKVKLTILTLEQISEFIFDLIQQVDELRMGHDRLTELTRNRAKLTYDANQIRDIITYLPQIQQQLTQMGARHTNLGRNHVDHNHWEENCQEEEHNFKNQHSPNPRNIDRGFRYQNCYS